MKEKLLGICMKKFGLRLPAFYMTTKLLNIKVLYEILDSLRGEAYTWNKPKTSRVSPRTLILWSYWWNQGQQRLIIAQ